MSLIVSAKIEAGFTSGDDTLIGTSAAQAFVIDNRSSTGQDTITTFGKNDSLLTTEKLFDSNGNDIITFGGDKALDVYGQGNDEIKMGGVNPSKGVRYLGEGVQDGVTYYVYATATVRPTGAIEGKVSNDVLKATDAADTFFYDTALGLNLGNDTIVGFGVGDKIVTTSKIWDSNKDGFITFGANGTLQIPGAKGGMKSDLNGDNGNIAFQDSDPFKLMFTGTTVKDGVTYYNYEYHALANHGV